MSDDAFESYLTHWREVDPQRSLAWLFLRRGERTRYGALAALQDEWLKAVRDAREPQVAAARLGWWREEMQRAVGGETRHPLTQGLFADKHVNEVPAACWIAALDACLLTLTAPPPTDLAAQLAAVRPLATAFADLDMRIWFGARTDSARAAAVAAVALLVADLRWLGTGSGNGRAPLPMNLLARHGLTADDLVSDGPALRAAVRDGAADLERELVAAASMPGPMTLFGALRLQRDSHTLALAARIDDPVTALRTPERGFRGLLKTWQAARIWRGTPVTRAHA